MVEKAEPIGVGIAGMGTFLPDDIRTNDWWPATWREQHATQLKKDVTGPLDEAAHRKAPDVDPEVARYAGPYFTDLFRGSRERRIMGQHHVPSDMEAAACRAALADAGAEASEVDALLGFSVVNDYAAMENVGIVADKLGLRQDVHAMEVRAACSSFLQQLRLASRLVQTGEIETALIYTSSAASRIANYETPSSVILGDGATAAVVRRLGPGLGYVATTATVQGDMYAAILLAPRDRPEVPWYRLDASCGPLVIQRMDERAAHFAGARAASTCRATVNRLFDATGYGPDDVAFFAISQAGAWFGRALADAVGIDHDRILAPQDHFERYGHMFAASTPLNLHLAVRAGRVRRGDLVLMFSPGVGFITVATLIRWGLDS